MSPEELADIALEYKDEGNIGVAFTYNEPLVGYEFVVDAAKEVHKRGMKTVLVSNGCVTKEVAELVISHIDAMNIDLKGFSDSFYRDFAGGSLEMVKAFISEAAKSCHVELTKLIIPGKNDSEEEMRQMTAWIAGLRGGRGREIPLHVTRYFPAYRWREPATEVSVVYRLARIAEETLEYVYTGNC
jgi:pyruvate formate lyase activating enzyme